MKIILFDTKQLQNVNKWLFVLKSLYLKQQRLRQQAEREKFVFLFTCLISNWPIPEREHKVFKYILKTKINSANSLSIACMVSSLFFCFFFSMNTAFLVLCSFAVFVSCWSTWPAPTNMTSSILLCTHGTLLVPVVVSAFTSFTSQQCLSLSLGC